MNTPNKLLSFCAIAAITAAAFAADAPPKSGALVEQAAVISAGAARTSILAATRAGKRIVAVGDRGIVLVSDDDGATYRQAKTVPTRAMLNAVDFAADGKSGWAVGHLGVVIFTSDGGETWRLQRDDLGVDQPLFSVSFVSKEHGFAAGLWSLLLETRDAGKTWQPLELSDSKEAAKGGGAGPNLFSVFTSAKGTIHVASERGVIYRSADGGKTWSAVQTRNSGTFWTGIKTRQGSLLAAGLSGKVYRSTDDGLTWSAVNSSTKSSITALAQLDGGRIVGVGLDGLTLTSDDDGSTFTARYLPSRAALTAVLAKGPNSAIAFSEQGPVDGTTDLFNVSAAPASPKN